MVKRIGVISGSFSNLTRSACMISAEVMLPKKKANTFESQQKLTFLAFSNSNGGHGSLSADDSVPLATEAAEASTIDSSPSFYSSGFHGLHQALVCSFLLAATGSVFL